MTGYALHPESSFDVDGDLPSCTDIATRASWRQSCEAASRNRFPRLARIGPVTAQPWRKIAHPSRDLRINGLNWLRVRILLVSNASYEPPKGGSTRSNLVWLNHLAKSGHDCQVVCSSWNNAPDVRVTGETGIEILSYQSLAQRPGEITNEVKQFAPDWILVSSEDLSHTLLREASASLPGRVVYLAHTPQFYPFGPDSWHVDAAATSLVKESAAIVAIAHYTASYIQQHTERKAIVIHPPIYGRPPYPQLGRWNQGAVLMINPCAVKGIDLFLQLAEHFPAIPFAGLAGWGTTKDDRARMKALPNVEVWETVASIDEALSRARFLLMPSIWHEGFGLIVTEAMLRGLPVISSDSGGLVEAKDGTGFVVPVKSVKTWQPVFDEAHMPVPVKEEQNLEPWIEAVRVLVEDESAYNTEAEMSSGVASKFVASLNAGDFEQMLLALSPREFTAGPGELSEAKRQLLQKRLRERQAR